MTEAIIILGHALENDGSCGQTLIKRLEKGAELFCNGEAPLVILSGGMANKAAGRAEAAAMREYLAEKIPDSAIVTEENSLTTLQNAKYTAKILKSRGIKAVTLVSSAYHIDRLYLNPVRLFKLFTGFKVKITAVKADN